MHAKYIILVAAIGLLLAVGQSAVAAETIVSFDSAITVKSDSSFEVQETITYDFGDTEHHGIFRDIPYRYARDGANYRVRLAVRSVTDGAGRPVPFQQSKTGGMIRVQIGDPDALVSGRQMYVVIYAVQRAINFFDDHDELYWNVTGNGWEVPIELATAEVSLPQAVPVEQWEVSCYTGVLGSTDKNCRADAGAGDGATFAASGALAGGEGLTIVVGWPKNIVVKPATGQQVGWFLADNWPIGLPVLALAVMYYLWVTRGRDPKGRGTIIPVYETPRGLPVAAVGTIVDERVDAKDISATIIQLAVRGYLKIREIEQKKLLFSSKDYELVKSKEADAALHEYEKTIFQGIFDAGETRTVSSLKNKFYVHLKTIRKQLYEEVVGGGYFSISPDLVRGAYLASCIFVTIGLVALGAVVVGGVAIAVAVVCGAAMAALAWSMPRKTKQGVETLEEIRGFQWFLSVTETDRLKFHNAPEKKPEQFEKLLPYAMVLGVESEWAKQFEGIYKTPPDWYEGRPGSAFNAVVFASALNSMSSSVNSAAVANPNSGAGGGSSGFGGGFSGGGFGGGGGGSW